MFITFEGVDGAGKSSHIEPLAQLLRDAGRSVVVTREPGGTPLAESLRAQMLQVPMDPMTEVLLAFAARRDHIQRVIAPALEHGEIVLCDRFTDSTYAYQGAGGGFDPAKIGVLEQWVQEGLQPDLTMWFDLDPIEAARRRSAARAADRFEAQSQAYFIRVCNSYAAACAASPGRFVRIDASLPMEAVWLQVRDAAKQRIVAAEHASCRSMSPVQT